jgi:two-component system response regulator BaeR
MSDVQTQQILVVEDESRLARLLEEYLTAAGYGCAVLRDGRQVVDWVRSHEPDLILLDIMLPAMDGLEVCRRVRAFSQVPIIFITARAEEIDRLLGLELGGDDYICKPFSPREVIARVKAVLRRYAAKGIAADTSGLIELDEHSLRVRAGGESVELTMVEYKLLEALYREPGRIFSRGQLMDRIYLDSRIVSDRTIDSHIKKLRKKLSILLPDLDVIQSVYGAGYRYDATSPPSSSYEP